MTLPIVVQASVYSDSHMAHASPLVLFSLEDTEVWLWVVTEKS